MPWGFAKQNKVFTKRKPEEKHVAKLTGKNYSEKIKKCLQKIDLITSLSSKKNIVHGDFIQHVHKHDILGLLGLKVTRTYLANWAWKPH